MYIDRSRCDGCGACLDACPMDAISLQDDLAFIDENLCEGCALCQSACPQDAIVSAEVVEPAREEETSMIPVPQPAQMVTTQPQPVAPSLRASVFPAIGSALLWAGREIVPRLASLALDSLDQHIQSARQTAPARRTRPQEWIQSVRSGGQRRRRHRRRRGNL